MSENHNQEALSKSGLLALVGPLIALAGIVIAIALSPWFTWDGNALSDLGRYATAVPAAVVFNVGLVTTGIIMLYYLFWFVRRFKDKITKFGMIPLGIALVFLILIGVLSEDFGYSHFVVSVGFFACFPFTMWIVGFGFLRYRQLWWFTVISVILPFFCLFMWVGWYGGLFPFLTGNAIPEITTALSAIGWMWIMWLLFYTKRLDHLLA